MAKVEIGFWNKFFFFLQHGIFGFAFGAARLVEFKLVSIETKWHYEMLRRLRWQRVSSDVRDCVFFFCILTKDMLHL